jgi:hypothetical protein
VQRSKNEAVVSTEVGATGFDNACIHAGIEDLRSSLVSPTPFSGDGRNEVDHVDRRHVGNVRQRHRPSGLVQQKVL